MAESRYSNQANTAPVISSMKNKKVPVPHSFFDLTQPIAFDAAIGTIIPFDLVETLPDSDYEISYDILAITKNPLVRRLLSGMTVYIHTYGVDSKSLWEGFPTFVTRGRSGRITRKVPVSTTVYDDDGDVFASHQFSPSAYLGLLPAHRTDMDVSFDDTLSYELDSSIETVSNSVTFNALPLVMYQQICIHNYLPSNLLQGNHHFFPEDEVHLKLSPTCGSDDKPIYCLSYDDAEAAHMPDTTDWSDVSLSSSETPVILDALRVRQFQGDRFNTGLPWPELVRGDLPSIALADDVTLTGSGEVVIPAGQSLLHDLEIGRNAPLEPNQNFQIGVAREASETESFSALRTTPSGSTLVPGMVSVPGMMLDTTLRNNQLSGTSSVSVHGSFQSSITLSQLNALKVLTLMRQRAALTDGSYNELIKAQYNTSPDLQVGKPYYIGGTKQPLIFNEVVQTSESSSNSPLGRTGSRAVTAGSGYIGRYHSKDFGYIMSVLTVVPDVYLTQGIDKLWTRVNHDDYHFPLMEDLEPEPILNKEVYYSGNSSVDDDVFAYQERNSEYKSRQPSVRGNLRYGSYDGDDEDGAYTLKRRFTQTPTLSYGYTGMFPSNIDYASIFSNSIDLPFIFSITSRIKATLPLSYVTMPNDGLTA